MNHAPDLRPIAGPLLSAVLGMLAGATATVLLRIARWRLDALSRAELLKTIEEYRAYYEDRDRQMAELRSEAAGLSQRVEELSEKLRGERDRVMAAMRLQVRWTRYARTLQRLLVSHGVNVPPEPKETDLE